MEVQFKSFPRPLVDSDWRSVFSLKDWRRQISPSDMMSEASEFATTVGKKNLISISTSAYGQTVVWYWGDGKDAPS
ncbi:MAG: hypothetical protein AAF907_06645, partial [Planctomycetota bacterium]